MIRKHQILITLTVTLTVGNVFSQQSSVSAHEGSQSDAFFLDLGVVIEPVTGNERISRYIKKSPEEVSFVVDKKPSGSIYMASTKELHATLKNINEKIDGLEIRLQNEMVELEEKNYSRMNDRISLLEKVLGSQMISLEAENKELRNLISDFLAQETNPYVESMHSEQAPTVPGIALDDYVELTPEEDVKNPDLSKNSFNRMVYMNGVLAYQRQDYSVAIGHLTKLGVSDLDDITAGNILYLLAESYFRQNSFGDALRHLARVDVLFESDKRDDAMALTGMVYRAMGDDVQAQQAFAEIIDIFPESEYLRLAQMELKKSINR